MCQPHVHVLNAVNIVICTYICTHLQLFLSQAPHKWACVCEENYYTLVKKYIIIELEVNIYKKITVDFLLPIIIICIKEPKTDKDEDHCKKVNEYLNNPPTPGSSRGGTGAAGLAGIPAELAAGLGK